jgi:serine/threonine-protein kinase
VHEIGRLDDGRPYFAMKLVKGRTLAQLLGQRAGPAEDLPRLLEVFAQVCRAVAYAHSQGVIHRDLKPANVMVGAFGEVMVMDWGLAKVRKEVGRAHARPTPAEEESEIGTTHTAPGGPGGDGSGTEAGTVLGTLAYMAPEQARGEVESLDERADVFGLGAILCAVLTGRPPFTGPKGRAWQQARRADLADAFARLDGCGADAELIGLAKRSLAAEAKDRPRDAGVLAQELTAYLEGVAARLRAAELERAAAEARAQEARAKAAAERRAWRLTAGLLAAGLLLVTLAGGAGWWYQRAEGRRIAREAQEAARRAKLEGDAAAALQEAEALGGQARKLIDDPPKRQGVLAAALSAARRAQSLLSQIDADKELAGQVDVVVARLEQDERDRRLLERGEEARLRRDDLRDGVPDRAGAAAEYREAFREWGLRSEDAPEDTVARLRAGPLRAWRLAALADWARVTPDPEERKRLGKLLQSAEDTFSKDWRAAARNRAKLTELAARPEARGRPPADLANLARDLRQAGATDAAEKLLREGLERQPGDFWLNYELARLLGESRRRIEAKQHWATVLALRPNSARVNYNLGVFFENQGEVEGALRCYRKATSLERNFALAHYNLGSALIQKWAQEEAMAEAIDSLRNAVRLDPNFAQAHVNLGNSLRIHGDVKEAARSYRKALDLRPQDPKVHTNAHIGLSAALVDQGQLDEAIGHCREAIRLDPNSVMAQINLGRALRLRGRFAESLVALRRSHELHERLTGRPSPVTGGSVRDAEAYVEREPLLRAVREKQATPVSPAEYVLFARMCRYTDHPAAAARLSGEALARWERMADDPTAKSFRHDAACAAALAGCGLGKDAPQDEGTRRTLRRRALGWLKADLDARVQEARGKPQAEQTMRRTLRTWQQRVDLAPVRDPAGLARLPEDERKEWEDFWAALRDRVRPGGGVGGRPQ